jgi:cell division GTPase FtsZ
MRDYINFIAIGQGGGRITQDFSPLNVSSCYINSDAVDVRDLSVSTEDLLLLETTGSGGSPSKGRAILNNNLTAFTTFIDSKLDKSKLNIFVIGLGGGTGGGMALPSVEYALNNDYKVGVIAALPPIMQGMLANDNAMRTLKELRSKEISMFILIDNQYLIDTVGISSSWWDNVNKCITKNVGSIFDIIREGKVSQKGLGSIDKAEIYRILQYGKGLLDVKTVYFSPNEFELTDNDIKSKLFAPQLIEGYNYKDTLAYIVNIDIPKANETYTEFSSKVFNITKGVCGSAISRLGMFTDPFLLDKVCVTIITAGLKLPKVLKSKINNIRRDSERHEAKKSKVDRLDFEELSSVHIDDDFSL